MNFVRQNKTARRENIETTIKKNIETPKEKKKKKIQEFGCFMY